MQEISVPRLCSLYNSVLSIDLSTDHIIIFLDLTYFDRRKNMKKLCKDYISVGCMR